tara:strand:+ start:430 stop:1146 length:717 start_codon:yes stop_codon:yes gene_type:complete
MKKTIAFIFARGGSKGLPLKNQLKLLNHPLIAYSIYIAKINPSIDDVYVSTDSEEIANISIDYGAKIILRPNKLAQDDSPEFLSWKHAINFLFNQGIYFDKFISLPPTSPLRSLKDTKICLDELKSKEEIIITVTPSHRNPWFNMVNLDNKKYATKIFSGKTINRRQDAPESFDISTVAYVAKTDFILNFSSIWDGKVKGVIIPKERALDIDDKYDFLIAQHLIKYRKDLIIDKNYLK